MSNICELLKTEYEQNMQRYNIPDKWKAVAYNVLVKLGYYDEEGNKIKDDAEFINRVFKVAEKLDSLHVSKINKMMKICGETVGESN